MMNKIIGFFASTVTGLISSKIPPCGAAVATAATAEECAEVDDMARTYAK
jgi:hypothetical protein